MASFVSGVSMALSTSPGDSRPCGGPGPCGDAAQSPLLRQQLNNSCAGAGRSADEEVASLRSLLRVSMRALTWPPSDAVVCLKELQRWVSVAVWELFYPRHGAGNALAEVSAPLQASSMSCVDVHDGTDPTVARFLAEERERSLELENLINGHIEELKAETERTLADYQRDLSPVH